MSARGIEETETVFDIGKFLTGKFAVVGGLVILICLFLIGSCGLINVKSTDIAVRVDKMGGKIDQKTYGVGYHFFNKITTDMFIYHVATRSFPQDSMKTEQQDNKWTLDLKTNDGQQVNIDLTVLYCLKTLEVPALHQQVGINYEDQVLFPIVRSEARIAIGNYSAEELYQGKIREEIQKTLTSKLQIALSKYPAIQIQDTAMRHFAFNGDFEKAIEAKKLAAQNVEVNKQRALAQLEESKRIEAEATGGKLKAIQEAQGRAQSAKTEADASRYAKEQEAKGNLALAQADAEGKRLQANALGSGRNVVALEFARKLAPSIQTVIVPAGQASTNLMDLSGFTKGLFSKTDDAPAPVKE